MTDHGQTVYEAHHAAMHAQTGRRQSHHKSYDQLTPRVRERYMAAGQAVAAPLEAENERLRARLAAVDTTVYLATIAHLAGALRDIRNANPKSPAGGNACERAGLALRSIPPGIPPGFAGVDSLRDEISATATETITEGKS